MKPSQIAILSVLILTACAAPLPPTATEAPQAVVVMVTPRTQISEREYFLYFH